MQDNETSLQRCLKPLLKWLKWNGSERDLIENSPYKYIASIEEFRDTLRNLGYKSHSVFLNLTELDHRLLPCVFISEETQEPIVITEKIGNEWGVYDPKTDQSYMLTEKNQEGVVVVFQKMHVEKIRKHALNWFKVALAPQKKLLYYIAFLSLLQALLLLAPPIFIISAYDKIIPMNSYHMLMTFFIGIMIALLGLTVVMSIRFRLLAYVGAYIQKNIGNMIFHHLLLMPPFYTEATAVGIQVARLNDFNSVRDFFSSPFFGMLIELPFIVIYIIAVWIIGGVLVWVPLIAIAVSLLIAFALLSVSRKNIKKSGVLQTQQQDFLVESFWSMRSIQYAALQRKWMARFRQLNSDVIMYAHKLLLMNSANDAIFDALSILSGLATIIVGALLVMDNKIQIGALIGVMFIIWRIITPIKTVGLMLPKIIQLKHSIIQIDELMRVPSEKIVGLEKSAPNHLDGAIHFSQVGFRYPGADVNAVADINFSIKPGQLLAIIGPSSAGKSTLANLLLAVYFPQIGRIYLDGMNIKQFDVTMLRTQIAYVPQKAELFYGTIAENLKLANPTASHEQLIAAATAANAIKEIEAMPKQFETFIGDHGVKQLGANFSQKINLARAYLRDAAILLLDEPSSALDPASTEVMLHYLQSLKGKKTIILITHDVAQVPIADWVIALRDGKQIASGDPTTVLEKISQGLI